MLRGAPATKPTAQCQSSADSQPQTGSSLREEGNPRPSGRGQGESGASASAEDVSQPSETLMLHRALMLRYIESYSISTRIHAGSSTDLASTPKGHPQLRQFGYIQAARPDLFLNGRTRHGGSLDERRAALTCQRFSQQRTNVRATRSHVGGVLLAHKVLYSEHLSSLYLTRTEHPSIELLAWAA